MIDELKKGNNFDQKFDQNRTQDPLDSTTTVNFMNMMNEAQASSSLPNSKKQRTLENEDLKKRENSKPKHMNPEQRINSKYDETKQTQSQD